MYKYNQIADSIREGIHGGKFKPGEKLPSILSYVKEYGYNSDTVVKAYKLLEEEHLIYAAPKSGYYVMKSLVRAEKKKGVIDLSTVRPPDCINPYKDFYHCMEKSISIYKNKLLEYATSQGMEELRAALVKHLMNFQIFTKQQDIFITNGAQQALYILAAMPFPGAGTKVVVEQPTYSVMLQALNCNKIPAAGVRRTEKGIDLEELEAIFKTGGVKFFYTMPRFQNPTGFSYNEKQKREILRLADRYGVYIAEDDYLADLELEERSEPLYAMGDKERIVYIRSFSKTLLPGLRLGMAVIPDALKKDFMFYKQSMDLNTLVLTQGALEIYLKSSMYKSHVARTKKFYKNKMEVLKKACELYLKDKVKYHIPPTGIYAFIEIPGNKAEAMADRLSKSRVLLNSTKSGCLDGFSCPQGIRLCTCNCENEEIELAVKRISQEIEKHNSLFNNS